MNAIDAYQLYHSIKLHFSSNYDYIKYNGKISPHVMKAFNGNRDQYIYKKLADHRDPKSFLIANAIKDRGGKLPYIRNLMTDRIHQDVYLSYTSIMESLTRNFVNDLDKIGGSVLPSLKVDKGYPMALELYRQKEISIQTLIILNDTTNCFRLWDRKLNDPVLWEYLGKTVRKYTPFFEYDKNKFKKILKNRIREHNPDE